MAVAPTEARTPWPQLVRMSLILAAVVAIVVLAFSWPGVTSEPQDLPVAVVGDGEQVSGVESALEKQQPGVFEFTRLPDRDAAVDAIESREVYGAIVPGAEAEVLTATAASPVAAQMLAGVATGLETAANKEAGDAGPIITVERTDLAPFIDSDPKGAGFASALFPLVLGGMLAGIALTMSIDGVARRVVGLLVTAAASGLLVTLVMHTWLGVLPGDLLATAGVFSVSVLAIGAPIAGFASIVGQAGVAIGPVLFMLIGNPIAGTRSPGEFLPGPWGAVGQLMPPGAGATLLRDVSYFPAADITGPLLVLAAWAGIGLLLAGVGHAHQSPLGRHERVAE